MSDAQTPESVCTRIRRIREKARQEPNLRFNSLAHLLTVELLRKAFSELREEARPGVDGVTAREYGQNLEKNLQDLHERLREGRYRAQPVRRAFIEKESGAQRPLGIPVLEDKLVQRATLDILEAIYEQDFLPCSYGYRPGRGAQDALAEVFRVVVTKKTNYILEADIKGYFDNIVREQLMEFFGMRIKDGSLLRLLGKWLHVGVVEGGRLLLTKKGTPQGAVISPLMANVYLHYVLDLWVERVVKPVMRGEVHVIRYADDFIVTFQYKDDADRFARVLPKRFAKFGLELHPDKTRLLTFGRFAAVELKRQDGRKPPTFDFLGFTHSCGTSRKGKFTVKVRTMRTRLRRTLRRIHEWCKKHRHDPIPEQRRILNRKLEGHYAYFGRPGNHRCLKSVHFACERIWFFWLRRREQRRRLTWAWFQTVLQELPLALPRIRQEGWRPT